MNRKNGNNGIPDEQDANKVTLVEQAAVLADSVDGLNLAVKQLERRTTKNTKIVTLTVLGLLLDLVLSVIVAFTLFNVISTANTLQGTIAEQDHIRTRVLCPLYGLFLGSYRPESRPAGQDRQEYEVAFASLRTEYNELSCTNPIVPPASQPTTVVTPTN